MIFWILTRGHCVTAYLQISAYWILARGIRLQRIYRFKHIRLHIHIMRTTAVVDAVMDTDTDTATAAIIRASVTITITITAMLTDTLVQVHDTMTS